MALPFHRLFLVLLYAGHGSVESEDAAEVDSAEAKGIPPMMGGRSLVERPSVHERVVCGANVRRTSGRTIFPGGTMRAWGTPSRWGREAARPRRPFSSQQPQTHKTGEQSASSHATRHNHQSVPSGTARVPTLPGSARVPHAPAPPSPPRGRRNHGRVFIDAVRWRMNVSSSSGLVR